MHAANAPLTKLTRSHATAVVFREPSSMDYDFYHNRPLYVEALVEGRKVRRALVDGGSGVNIIPTVVFHAMGLPFDQLRPTSIKLNTFHGEAVAPRGFIVVMLEVRPIKMPNKFQVVDGEPSYHILLGCPWLHLHQCVPSTWHQCIKSSFKGKDIEIPITKAPFDTSEAHLIDAGMFDELAPQGINEMHLCEKVQLGTKKGKEKANLSGAARPTQAFKKPKEQSGRPRVQRERLPSREFRWRIL